jgi:adenosylcobinamide-GDP ribazoletransferase
MTTLTDIGSAVRLLTVVPLPGAEGKRPVRWFPLVGLGFGAVGVGLAWAGGLLGLASTAAGALVLGTLIVGAWALLSGMLHWDGLADSADGIGVRGDSAARLAAMRGSAIGAYGATAVVFVALLQVAAVAALVENGEGWALLAAPVIARFGAGAALLSRRPARPDGLAVRYAGSETLPGVLIMVVVAGSVALVAPDYLHVLLAFGSLLLSLAIPAPFTRRLGGITGDVLGATILLTETLVLVGAVLLQAAA